MLFILNNFSPRAEKASRKFAENKVASLVQGLQEEEIRIVVFSRPEDTKLYTVTQEALSDLSNNTVILETFPDVAQLAGVPFPSLCIFRPEDEKSAYSGPVETQSIRRWFLLEELPLIVPYTPFFTRKAFNKELNINTFLIFFAPQKNPGSMTKQARQELKAIAQKYRNQLIILHMPSENPRLLDYFGVRASRVPAVVLVHYIDGEPSKYEFSDAITENNLSIFIDRFFRNELKPFLRSEEEPLTNPGPVFVGLESFRYA